ncbi:hypothetical protein GQ53DRAFT_807492 [Thozetella sp. PMI_491]|nr:hypothetical protein GQ53DRAFT_807492 [Thozetella sp. PMI_491]
MAPHNEDGTTVSSSEVMDIQPSTSPADRAVSTGRQLVSLPPEIFKHIMVQLDSIEDLESLIKAHEGLNKVVEKNQEISAAFVLKNVGPRVFRQLVMAVEVSTLDVQNAAAVDAFYERHPTNISSYKCSVAFAKQAIALMDTVRAVNTTIMSAFKGSWKDVPSSFAELCSDFTPSEQDRFSCAALCTEFYARLLAHYLVRANGSSEGPYRSLDTSGYLEAPCVAKAGDLFGIVGLAQARCFEAELYQQLHIKLCSLCRELPDYLKVPVVNCIQLEQAGSLYALGKRGAYGAYVAVAGLAKCAHFLNPSTPREVVGAEFQQFHSDISESIHLAHFFTYQDVYHTNAELLRQQLLQPFGKFGGHEQWILNVWWYRFRNIYRALCSVAMGPQLMKPWTSRISLFLDDWRLFGLTQGEMPSFDETGHMTGPTREQLDAWAIRADQLRAAQFYANKRRP